MKTDLAININLLLILTNNIIIQYLALLAHIYQTLLVRIFKKKHNNTFPYVCVFSIYVRSTYVHYAYTIYYSLPVVFYTIFFIIYLSI